MVKKSKNKKPSSAKRTRKLKSDPMTLGIVHRLMRESFEQRAQMQKNLEQVFKANQSQIMVMMEAANHAAKVFQQMNEMLQASAHMFQQVLIAQRDLHERVNMMVTAMNLPRLFQDIERWNSIVNGEARIVESSEKAEVVHVPTPIVDEEELVQRIEDRIWAKIETTAKTRSLTSPTVKALPDPNATVDLFLTPSGKLYKIPNNRVFYPFVAQNRNALKELKENKRLKLIKYLANGQGEYISTPIIQHYINSSSEQATRRSISTMNKKIGSKLGLLQPLLDHNQGSGYRINPVYKIFISDKEL